MKEIRKTIYRVNREWLKVEDASIVGDMYWHFQVADDSRTLNLDELVKSLRANIHEDIPSLYDKDDKESFALYIVEKGNGVLELDDDGVLELDDDDEVTEQDIDSCLWQFDIDGQWESVVCLAACTEEYRKQFECLKDFESVL